MFSQPMLAGTYDHGLVALSVVVSICSAYAALDLSRQLYKTRGFEKLCWLSGGSFAMGAGIWSMHYIGMQAFRLPMPIEYDWPTVGWSVFISIASSSIALFEASRPGRRWTRTLTASTVIGLGIASMHYIGMHAMRLPAKQIYSPKPFAASILLAVGISYLALELSVAARESLTHISWRKVGSAIVMGAAISSMHYVGMAAVTFMPLTHANASTKHVIDGADLAPLSVTVTVLILILSVLVLSHASRQSAQHAGELADARANIQTIFDQLKEAVMVFDLDRNIVLSNQAAVHLLGLPEQFVSHEYIASTFEVFLPTGELVPSEAMPSALAQRGEFLQNCELKVRRTDTGSVAIVDVTSAPIRNHAGKIIQFILSYRDITQPKEIDEARIRLASIVESSEDAIIGKDTYGIVNSWNSGAEIVFGYSAEEMIGQSVRRLLPEDRLHEEDDILLRVQRGEKVDHIETVRRRKNGQFIHVSLMISPIRDASGRVIGASKIARNITDRKKLENQLFQSQKMEAIGQLTGGIAHDFNNLLAVVIGNLDLLERQVLGNEPALKRVKTARNASLRGADLTSRLLAFARQQELQPDCVSLNSIILNVLSLASPAFGPEIEVVTQLDASLPGVLVDAPGLESALLNLLMNARDAMPQGGKLTVSSGRRTVEPGQSFGHGRDLKVGSYASVSVSDSGIGMSPEVVQKAFEPFFTTKTHGKGTGLGLAMVHGFFIQSGGSVHIYSERGYGTTVTFYLPLSLDDHAPVAVMLLPDQAFDTLGTILIVDDEEDLREVASASLAELGYTVLTASDGPAAQRVLDRRDDVQVLLTDIIMPGGMSGVELARRVHERRPEIQVIYCSGFPADALAERLTPLANGPLLRKPYQRLELLNSVRKAFAASSSLARGQGPIIRSPESTSQETSTALQNDWTT